ncbi:MAG: hypothetical protein IKD52_12995 [Exiguobacterium sp.]|nr:hypothetical protein [Exiguobacterium sp.]
MSSTIFIKVDETNMDSEVIVLATGARYFERIPGRRYLVHEGVPSGKCGFTTLSTFSRRFPHF